MHNKCENSALCHLCDGESLYKNTREQKAEKRAQRERNKENKKHELLRTYNKEKKEGMGFEKRVANAWNGSTKKKNKITKPRLGEEIFAPDSTTASNDAPRPKPTPSVTGLNLSSKSSSNPSSTSSPNKLSAYSRTGSSGRKNEARRQVNSGAMWHSKGDIRVEHALMECKERGTVNGRGEKTISIPKEWLEKQEKEAFQEGKPFWYLPFGYKNSEDIYLIKDFNHEVEMIQEIRNLEEENARLRKLLEEKGDS